MRILLSSSHRYPARRGGGGASRVHDWLATGLVELGHEVFYLLGRGAEAPFPPGLVPVPGPVRDVDISHNTEMAGRPWVRTCHVAPVDPGAMADNWIFVSRTFARSYGRDRYVLNGIDPGEYVYSEAKDGYFLFIASLGWGVRKGFDIAASLAIDMGFKLVIAGAGGDEETMRAIGDFCRRADIHYVGEVEGERKAELFTRARALLLPTRLNEGCPTVILEALMSGTPVICSDRGACPELVSPEVGFVCAREEDYVQAIEGVGEISSRACRDRAMREFHYLRMARDYVREYEKEIGRASASRTRGRISWPKKSISSSFGQP